MCNGKKKTGKCDDVTFVNRIFDIFKCRTSKQMTFLESWDKIGHDRYVLKRNFWVSKFGLFWPDLDLNLGQIWKWVSPSNSTFQMTHKTCVTRYSCYIFMWWPHLTWPWPWPVLSISLLLTWHLRHPISSILTGFELAAISGLVFAVDKVDTIQLWPLTWTPPDIWPC